MATDRKPEVTIELKPEGTPDTISALDIVRGIKTEPLGEPRKILYSTHHNPTKLLFPRRDRNSYKPPYKSDI